MPSSMLKIDIKIKTDITVVIFLQHYYKSRIYFFFFFIAQRLPLQLDFTPRDKPKFVFEPKMSNNNIFHKPNEMLNEMKMTPLPPFKNPWDNKGYNQNLLQPVSISDKAGKLTITPLEVYEFDECDLHEIKEIGHGEFGHVYKVMHKPSNTLMALKVFKRFFF